MPPTGARDCTAHNYMYIHPSTFTYTYTYTYTYRYTCTCTCTYTYCILYSGKFSWEKIFANRLQLRFFSRIVKSPMTTPTILNCCEENFCYIEASNSQNLRKSSPTKISRYTLHMHTHIHIHAHAHAHAHIIHINHIVIKST